MQIDESILKKANIFKFRSLLNLHQSISESISENVILST
jgi:hypothetical protein